MYRSIMNVFFDGMIDNPWIYRFCNEKCANNENNKIRANRRAGDRETERLNCVQFPYVIWVLLIFSFFSHCRKKADLSMEGQFLIRQIYDDEITYNLIGAAVEILSKYSCFWCYFLLWHICKNAKAEHWLNAHLPRPGSIYILPLNESMRKLEANHEYTKL